MKKLMFGGLATLLLSVAVAPMTVAQETMEPGAEGVPFDAEVLDDRNPAEGSETEVEGIGEDTVDDTTQMNNSSDMESPQEYDDAYQRDPNLNRPTTLENGTTPDIEAFDQYSPEPDVQDDGVSSDDANTNYESSQSDRQQPQVQQYGDAYQRDARLNRPTTLTNGDLPDMEVFDEYRPEPDVQEALS